jgi:hypothetical protein
MGQRKAFPQFGVFYWGNQGKGMPPMPAGNFWKCKYKLDFVLLPLGNNGWLKD